jgi:vitamin B12 transporter
VPGQVASCDATGPPIAPDARLIAFAINFDWLGFMTVSSPRLSRRLALCAGCALLSLAAPAMAAEQLTDPGKDPGVAQLVVTATRTPTRLDKVGSSITLLTQTDIQRSQQTGATELLASTPGVTYSRNGATGKATSIYIRGAESDQTVVLIDGVKLNDPSATGGGYSAANLLIGNVSRIEILRGAQSTLWGSQAIGGVINTITKEPTKAFEGDISGEGGSYKTAYVRGGVGGISERLMWRAAASYFTTDGVSSYVLGKEDDGYRNVGATGRLRYNFTPNVSVDLRSVYSKGHNEFDNTSSDAPQTGDTKELVAYAGLNVALFEGRFTNRLAYAYTDTDRVNYNPLQANTPLTFDAAGRNDRVEYQGNVTLADGYTVTFGAENERSRFRTASPTSAVPAPASRTGKADIHGVYAQISMTPIQGLTLTGGVRRDDHSTAGAHAVGQLSAAYSINEGNTVLRASYGEGFKSPSLYQLYSEYGNTALDPEQAKSWDAGVEQRFFDGKLVAQATYFHRDTDNLIVFVSCPSPGNATCASRPGSFGYYDNVSKARAKGWELGLAAKPIERLTLDANYTSLEAQDVSPGSATYSRFLVRRPKQSANVSATYEWPFGLVTTVAARRTGSTFNNAANTQRLKQYTLVDLRVSYPINDSIELFARMENVFEQTYQTTLNYGTLGQTSYAGIRYRF